MELSYRTTEEYIAGLPEERAAIIKKIRETIRELAPDSTEAIKYGMPTFVLNGNLVHYAAQKNHVGFYPTSSGIQAFKTQLSSYKTSKGAIQFPYDREIPYDLIREIVKFRVTENLQKKRKK